MHPDAPSFALDARDAGARGDGSVDDAPALQRALDSGRGTIYVPAGIYRIGHTLRIASRTRLELHPAATLIMAEGMSRKWDDFLITNRNHETGDHDIEISGGTWDGNNVANSRTDKLIDPGVWGGVMINFLNVENLRLSDMTLRNPTSYHVRMSKVSNFLVEHIRFRTTSPMNNNDGIHLGGFMEKGIIRHLHAAGRCTPNDDLVALNADDAIDRTECYGKLRGPIRNVIIHDLVAEDCHSFVRLLSTDAPIENIDISRLRGGCRHSVLNLDGARQCRVKVFDESDPKYANGVGDVRHVRLTDAVVYKSGPGGLPLLCLQETMDDFEVSGLVRDETRDAALETPTLQVRYVPRCCLTLEGLSSEQVERVRQASSMPVVDMPLVRGAPERGRHLMARPNIDTELVLPSGSIPRMRVGMEIEQAAFGGGRH